MNRGMEQNFIEEKTFDKIDFRENFLTKGEYEKCTFSNCDFSGSDFSEIRFAACEFLSCNVSLVNLTNAIFNDIFFKDSKLLGLRFSDCSKFGFSVRFENCILSHSSFFKTNLKKTTFKASQLHEVDFADCDLSGSDFDHCDLAGALFENTNIEKSDFRSSFNYSINPEINRMKKAKFSLDGIRGLLDKYNIEIEG
jgi:fluoroquinolone resistance protein